jgi:hypothetical protein
MKSATYQRHNQIYLNCRTKVELGRAVSVLKLGLIRIGTRLYSRYIKSLHIFIKNIFHLCIST